MAEGKEPQKRSLGRGLGSLLGEDVLENFKVNLPPVAPTSQIPMTPPPPVSTQSSQSSQTPPVTTPVFHAEAKPMIAVSEEPVATLVTPPVSTPLTTTPAPAQQTSQTSSIPDSQRIWQIDIEKLTGNVYQPRKVFVSEKLQELAASIKEKGILQPIVARRIDTDHFEIIAGERRWRAAQLAGLKKVPIILKDVENQESLELALIENLQRHDLNPIEEAEAYQQLANEFSLNQQEIGLKVGKDRATVANSLRLLNLIPEIRQMLAQGEITTGHAKALLALSDPGKQRALAKKITSEKLTVRAAERMVQGSMKRTSDGGPGFQMDVAGKLVKGLEEDLTKTLGTKVEISYNKGKGNIAIRFYSDEDLTRIIEKIKNV